MRVITIRNDRLVEEADIDLDELFEGKTLANLVFDAEHDIVYDENAMFAPGLAMAKIGEHTKVPLPAFICGVDREHFVDAKITIDQVSNAIS